MGQEGETKQRNREVLPCLLARLLFASVVCIYHIRARHGYYYPEYYYKHTLHALQAALHYTTYSTYTTLHYTTLHYIALHYTTLQYTTLHYSTLHYTTLHYTTLDCTRKQKKEQTEKQRNACLLVCCWHLLCMCIYHIRSRHMVTNVLSSCGIDV